MVYLYTQNLSLLPKNTILSNLLPLFSKDPYILLYSLLLYQTVFGLSNLCLTHAHSFLRILIDSFGCALNFPHSLHLTTFNGSYIGIKTLALGSEEAVQ